MIRNLSRSHIDSVIEKAKTSSPDEALLFTIAEELLEGDYPSVTVHSFLESGHLPLIIRLFISQIKRKCGLTC